MSKITVVSFLFISLSIFLVNPCFAQSNYTESLTITTYYPSPYGVYRNLEVKSGLAIGDITKGPLGSMNNLTQGQLYINGSVILNSLSTYPPTPWRAGQVIYYVGGGEKMLKFCNGTDWVNATGGTTIIGLLCGANSNKTLSSKPTTNLCSAGTSSVVSGTGPWTWDCTKDGYSSPCTAYPVMCGSSNGKNLGAKPTTNLCAVGANTPVLGTGPWTWDCVIGTYSASCSANKCTAQAHYPAKKCGHTTIHCGGSGCPDIWLDYGCTTRETWGYSDTCTFWPNYCCTSWCDYVACTGTCTNEWDGTYSCPP